MIDVNHDLILLFPSDPEKCTLTATEEVLEQRNPVHLPQAPVSAPRCSPLNLISVAADVPMRHHVPFLRPVTIPVVGHLHFP